MRWPAVAALRVLGPSSAWFLAAAASMSRVSSSGDLVESVLRDMLEVAATPSSGASCVFGRLDGMSKVGCTRHPSKKKMPGKGVTSWEGPACCKMRPVRALYNPDGRQQNEFIKGEVLHWNPPIGGG